MESSTAASAVASANRLWRAPGIMSPTVATILASYNCTAACEHCCFDSHPGIKQRLSRSEILDFIGAARKFTTMRLIVFSGGECFLLGDDLVAAVQHAKSLGLRTRCVTNGYWARTEKAATARLVELKAAGLDELNVSTGDFHQKYVPQRSVVNGAVAGVKLDIPTVIMIEMQKVRGVTARSFMRDPRIAALHKTQKAGMLRMVESPWMPMSADKVIEQPRGRAVDRFNVDRRKGCRSVLTTLVMTPTHKVGICCGLTREHIPELHLDFNGGATLREAYEDAAADFMRIWLFVEGPDRILAWAATKDQGIEWEGRYAHHCQSCLALFNTPRVRQVIRDHYHEKVSEVLMRYALIAKSGQALSPELENSDELGAETDLPGTPQTENGRGETVGM